MGLNSILLVDDDNITNFINKRLISKHLENPKIEVALNGEEGIDYIKDNCNSADRVCPELILLDINMPVMDGIEFLSIFNKMDFNNKENVKVAILTTSSNQKDVDKVKNLGDFEYINKPLTEAKLKNLLSKNID